MMADLADVVTEDDRWTALGIEALSERAFGAVLAAHDLNPARFEIALLACDDARIAGLNSEFRAKSQPTNVLSWPARDLSADADGAIPELPPTDSGNFRQPLGDIAISFATCEREADAHLRPLKDHAMHLLVHGCLHLLGYDHISDKDAALMEGLEVEILAKLGIANPY